MDRPQNPGPVSRAIGFIASICIGIVLAVLALEAIERLARWLISGE